MKVFSLANYKENIILPKEFKRLIPWRPDDLLQAEYDQENKTLMIYNLSERSLYVDKKTVNYSSVKIFEIKDYWNKLTGNEEFMTLELEKIFRESNEFSNLEKEDQMKAIDYLRTNGKLPQISYDNSWGGKDYYLPMSEAVKQDKQKQLEQDMKALGL